MGVDFQFFVISRKKPIDVWELISYELDSLYPKKCSASSKLKRICDLMEKNLHKGNLNVLKENGNPGDSVCICKLEIWLSILSSYSEFLYLDSVEVTEIVNYLYYIYHDMEEFFFDGKFMASDGGHYWQIDATEKYGKASYRSSSNAEQILKNH